MSQSGAHNLGNHLKRARLRAGISQTALAKRARVNRLKVVRAENALYIPRLDEAARLAGALKVPLQLLAVGQWSLSSDLRGIAFELFHLGVRDLEVSDPRTPGAFRHAEEVLVLALAGDRPEPRVIEAIPAILAKRKFNARLALAFAAFHDLRVRTRLAWLSDITAALNRLGVFASGVKSEAQLGWFISKGVRAEKPDSLGHPGEDDPPRIWRRWNVNYAGDLASFKTRAQELQEAYEQESSQTSPEEDA